MKIAVSREIPEAGLNLLREASDDVRVWDGALPPSRDQLLKLAQGCDGLLTLLTDPVDGTLLDELNTLRVISNFAVGYDNINVSDCSERGVAACITPDVLTDTTADFAFSLLLSSARLIVPGASTVASGEWKTWEPLGFLGQDIHHQTIGIVGFGRIGQAVARRALGFGMTILYTEPAPRAEGDALGAKHVKLGELLERSDFVTLHVPLTEETRHMIGADELRKMKSSAILINTARGPVVDTQALISALDSNEIWTAALDVTNPEPLPADHPLSVHPRCLVTPHIASASLNTREKMAELAAMNLLAVLRNEEPPRCLNPEVLKHGQD